MQLTVKVDIGDGPVIVTTNLQSTMAWELRFNKRFSDLADGIGLNDLAFMAWDVCKQNQVVVPVEFDTFKKKLITLEVVSQEQPVPFDAAATDAH